MASETDDTPHPSDLTPAPSPPTISVDQAMAELKQNLRILQQSVALYSMEDVVDEARLREDPTYLAQQMLMMGVIAATTAIAQMFESPEFERGLRAGFMEDEGGGFVEDEGSSEEGVTASVEEEASTGGDTSNDEVPRRERSIGVDVEEWARNIGVGVDE